MRNKQAIKKARFRLRTILLTVSLSVLVLPGIGGLLFRSYENALVRQTEAELISQAAVISSIYKQSISKHLPKNAKYGERVNISTPHQIEEYYSPVLPQIDLSKNQTLPTRPDGKKNTKKTDNVAKKVAQDMSYIIRETQKSTLAGIKVLDYRGISIAGRYEIGLDFSSVIEIQRALSGHYTSVIRKRISGRSSLESISRGTGIRIFVAYPIIHKDMLWGVVYLSRTPESILKHVYTRKMQFISIGLLVLCATLLLALLTSYTISRPLNELIKKIQKFTSGDIDHIEPVRSPELKEIELLSESFVQMAESLNSRTDYIRDFAMHISHEFKTPLTSIQGSTELLLEHLEEMPPEKRQKFLSNILADSNRLKQLVSRLLEVAKADNVVPTSDISSLSNVLFSLEQRYEDFGLKINQKIDQDYTIKMSTEYLETILFNLCDNAKQSGATTLSIVGSREGSTICLTIRDDGPGISSKNTSNIFTPFFTTKRADGGTGLGLSIVHSLLEAHDGSIQLKNSRKGACFKVTMPIIDTLLSHGHNQDYEIK